MATPVYGILLMISLSGKYSRRAPTVRGAPPACRYGQIVCHCGCKYTFIFGIQIFSKKIF
jgi:hypothetical protein